MKRYERMTKEEIMEAFKASDKCYNCRFKDTCAYTTKTCCEQIADYLGKETKLKTVSRWQMIKSDKDLKKIRQDFCEMCSGRGCGGCSYITGEYVDCFVNYLLEKIEVEET